MGNLFSLDAWNLVWTFKCTFILGFLTTVGVSLSALVISLTLGIAFGLMATSGNKILSAVSRVYVKITAETAGKSVSFKFINVVLCERTNMPDILNFNWSLSWCLYG